MSDKKGSVATRDRTQVREPSLYKVLLHNDDYTSMEFVIAILENVFGKNTSDASKIMMNVHQEGVGVAGIYTREICETKVAIVHELARQSEYPLRCSIEQV
ncbi:MAG: ATP-dependent Clp protease adapter ClpS [Proteobacteria bacterium]|nr:ATP-dependent Clp protease adapter ClpS [Pseudomonadota bacterium]MBU1232916.1 ATP-dependent Clp protease adapter ClpS [Pseudomonadota bacterium]MBU1417708.1 ATP-dependent Clp protease adapter ClpS [Pseudomonadota bacterium]MBU1454952.1 ATP-dependent Clp protease adapter ClpS [Pseudomonadota bacterium]